MNPDVLSCFRNPRYESLNKLRWEHFLSMGIPLENKTVFEPGAGVGDQTEWLLDQGVKHIYVMDGRDENVAIITERFGSEPRVTILQPANLEGCLPFYNFTVDFIFCYGVYYHLGDLLPDFRILRDLSRIGGTIALDYLAGDDTTQSYGYDNPSTSMTRFGVRPRTETLLAAMKDIWGHAYAPKNQLEWVDPVATETRLIAVASTFDLENSNLLEFDPVLTPLQA